MTRDYKYRTQEHHYKRSSTPKRGNEWPWLLTVLLIASFAAFLIYLRSYTPPSSAPAVANRVVVKKSPPPKAEPTPRKPFEPTFDFYTILPEQEVVVSEPEIKTRAREESIGKNKDARYMIQAGSFRSRQDAEKVKAQLALMGIQANIETAQNGSTTWNRVKIGPLSKMAKVDAIRSRLHSKGIDAVVMQLGR
ncbi:MAG: SPOR domain-containing protein [Gammaproteobacteria bacterium]